MFYTGKTQADSLGHAKNMVHAQYAGSVGFLSAGYTRTMVKNKLELGLAYGYLPASKGGTVHTASFKFTYNPFAKRKTGIHIEPLAGFFIAQHFGNNLGVLWGDNYPKKYYWWPRALRTHVFIAGQISWYVNKKKIDRMALYLEANTNDLYISSYYTNPKSLQFSDIIYLGAGLKLYFR